MGSLGWINLAVVLVLFAFIHEGSTEPGRWLQIIFRARQAEARRNRLKFRPLSEGQKIKHQIFTGFVLTNTFTDFVMPKLSNDVKLDQVFTKTNGLHYLVCTKESAPDDWISPQKNALNHLNRGKPFFYSPILKDPNERINFKFIHTPLSQYENDYYRDGFRYTFCKNMPMPTLKMDLVKGGGISLSRKRAPAKFLYGEEGSKLSCERLEFGIESIPTENEDTEDFNETLRKGPWAELFQVCYDKTNSVTAFTKHIIYSKALTHRKLNPNLDTSASDKSYVDGDIDKMYDLDNQKRSFESNEELFEKELEAFDIESNYLVRARLVPDYDTLYETWQYATHNYINIVPMWRSVNLGQWLKVEQDIRHMATKWNKNLTVYTGVYYKKDSKRLYLIDKKKKEDKSNKKKKPEYKSIPIPSVFYKYVHSTQDPKDGGIVLITANGVSGSLNDIKCKDVCHLYGWLFTDSAYKHRNRTETGLTKCCTPVDFFSQAGFSGFIPNPPLDGRAFKKIFTFGGKAVDVKPYAEQSTNIQMPTGMPPGYPPMPQSQTEESSIAQTMIFDKNAPRPTKTGSYLIGGDL